LSQLQSLLLLVTLLPNGVDTLLCLFQRLLCPLLHHVMAGSTDHPLLCFDLSKRGMLPPIPLLLLPPDCCLCTTQQALFVCVFVHAFAHSFIHTFI